MSEIILIMKILMGVMIVVGLYVLVSGIIRDIIRPRSARGEWRNLYDNARGREHQAKDL